MSAHRGLQAGPGDAHIVIQDGSGRIEYLVPRNRLAAEHWAALREIRRLASQFFDLHRSRVTAPDPQTPQTPTEENDG